MKVQLGIRMGFQVVLRKCRLQPCLYKLTVFVAQFMVSFRVLWFDANVLRTTESHHQGAGCGDIFCFWFDAIFFS